MADAIAELRTAKFDVVLIDYILLDGSGLEVLAEAKDKAVCIFLSGLADKEVCVTAMKDGAYDFIIKETNASHLAVLPTVIDSAMEKHRLKLERERLTKELLSTNEELSALSKQLAAQNLELEQTRELAEMASRSKSQFLANMSHELRTPLALINGSADVLLDSASDALNEQQLMFLRRIHENGQHLLGIINDLLDLANIETGKMVLEVEPMNIGVLLQQISKKFEPKIKEAGLAVNLVGLEQVVHVNGDPLRLKHVLVHLLSNALKFTNTGTITIFLKLADGLIKWGVKDTGIGITEQALRKAFEPLEQVEEILKNKIQGAGLGLALSR